VEVGAAIIGASLPTIRPLFIGKSTESIIRSVRSAFSLQSRNTKRSGYEDHSLENDDVTYHLPLVKTKSKSHSSVNTSQTRNETEASEGNWRVEP